MHHAGPARLRDWEVDTGKLSVEAALAGLIALVPLTVFLAAPPLGGEALSLPALLTRMMQGGDADAAVESVAGWGAYCALGAAVAIAFAWLVVRRHPEAGGGAGAAFALGAWAVLQLVFFPMMGLGVLGLGTGGGGAAVASLVAFTAYGYAMGALLRAAVRLTAIPVLGFRES